jgi:hypothetical protein
MREQAVEDGGLMASQLSPGTATEQQSNIVTRPACDVAQRLSEGQAAQMERLNSQATECGHPA